MASYTHTTLGQARAALSLRLSDPGLTFWGGAELNAYIVDALRTWNALSWAFRDRGLITSVVGQAFYDTRVKLVDGGFVQILGPTLQDRDLVSELQLHLLEPAQDWTSGSSWTGTEMFSMEDLQEAVQRRLNQFLLETGQIVSESKLSVGAGVSRVSLPDTVADVRRAAWVEMDGADETTYSNLWRADDFQLSQFAVGINLTPELPQVYSVATMPETEIKLSPPTNAPGKLHLLTIDSGTPLDVTIGVPLGILDDFAHIVKWGAMADLLGRDGPAKDEERAIYCQQRWEAGVLIAGMMSTVLSAFINEQSVNVVSVFDLDVGQPNWQSTFGAPAVVAMSGANQIALAPVPSGIYSITLDVVKNAIVPNDDSDYLQVGREYLDTILDCAQHLAAFKQGGKEFKDSVVLYQRFMKSAVRFNDRLRAQAPMFDALADNLTKEEVQRPRVEQSDAKAVSA